MKLLLTPFRLIFTFFMNTFKQVSGMLPKASLWQRLSVWFFFMNLTVGMLILVCWGIHSFPLVIKFFMGG